MCGIFGIGFLKGTVVKEHNKILDLINLLGMGTESYGRHCSGVTIASPFKLTFAKYPEKMTSFLQNENILNMLKTNLILNSPVDETNSYAVVAHCRYPTQGAKENNNNNHPIKVGNIIGVHAGCVSSDHQLFKANINNFKRIGEVDSEIIFQLLNSYRGDPENGSMIDAIKRTAPLLKGSFTCAVLSNTDKYKLYLFRSGPTLDVTFYKNLGLLVFATSYKSIVEPAMKKTFGREDIENKESIALENGTGLAINLRKNTYTRFSLLESNTILETRIVEDSKGFKSIVHTN